MSMYNKPACPSVLGNGVVNDGMTAYELAAVLIFCANKIANPMRETKKLVQDALYDTDAVCKALDKKNQKREATTEND